MARIASHTLEWLIGGLMTLFGIAAVWIFIQAASQEVVQKDAAIIEILLIIVLAILAQTAVLIRIYEQNQQRDNKPF